jgi:hypothetical protein
MVADELWTIAVGLQAVAEVQGGKKDDAGEGAGEAAGGLPVEDEASGSGVGESALHRADAAARVVSDIGDVERQEQEGVVRERNGELVPRCGRIEAVIQSSRKDACDSRRRSSRRTARTDRGAVSRAGC